MTSPQLTCLLTGATNGIGQAGAIRLAEKGYTLFLTARSDSKAAQRERLIKARVPDARIHWLMGDFSRLSDIDNIAREFLDSGAPLDLLWLNAGLCYNQFTLSHDGYEMMWAVNHLAPFRLTQLLFDTLCEGSAPLRIVVTASAAHKSVNALNLDVNEKRGFKTFRTYGNSKLANILFTQSLAAKLEAAAPQKSFTVNSFHPGFVGTGIGTQVTLGKILMALCRPFVRSSAKGAETGLFLALDPSVQDKCGGYYFDSQIEPLQPYARDMDMAETLWETSQQMVISAA